MSTTISSNGLPQLPLATSGAEQASSQTTAAGNATGSSTAAATPRESVSLKLTDSARALQRTKNGDTPVDSARVTQLRQALADGSYKVDSSNIANKLVALDTQIGGK